MTAVKIAMWAVPITNMIGAPESSGQAGHSASVGKSLWLSNVGPYAPFFCTFHCLKPGRFAIRNKRVRIFSFKNRFHKGVRRVSVKDDINFRCHLIWQLQKLLSR